MRVGGVLSRRRVRASRKTQTLFLFPMRCQKPILALGGENSINKGGVILFQRHVVKGCIAKASISPQKLFEFIAENLTVAVTGAYEKNQLLFKVLYAKGFLDLSVVESGRNPSVKPHGG